MILESIVNCIDYVWGWATIKVRTSKAKAMGRELYSFAAKNTESLTQGQQVSHRLMALRLGYIPNKKFGICGLVGSNFLEYMFDRWPLFSGWSTYPVPSLDTPLNPRTAFGLLPKWEGAYGEERLDLVRFLSNELTQKIIDRAKKKGHNAKISLLEEAWEFVKENGL